MEAHEPIPTLRALKYYPEEPAERQDAVKPRDDVLLEFVTQRSSVTPPELLLGDCIDEPAAYCADPMLLVELRGGAVTRDGFVFTERNELLRESVDRLSYADRLSEFQADLEAELAAASPEPSPESVAVLGCQRTVNYFHWWIDVVAKCWLIGNSRHHACRLVTGPLVEDFQRESLQLLDQSVTPLTRPIQRFRSVVFARGLTPGSSQVIAPQVTEFAQWCRAKLELSPSARWRKLFLSRRSAKSRKLVNEDEVLAALGAEFELVEPETLSMKDEARLFSEASLIVAPHGAGLTNLLFCSRPTAVVELVYDDAPPHTFRRMAGLLGHPYIAVGCKPHNQAQLKVGRRDMTAPASEVAAAAVRLEELSHPV